MGLIQLVKNLDAYTKTELLGSETTRILRLTFTNSDYEALDDNILNEAILIQKGNELVRNKNLRMKLIDSLKKEQLQNFGIRNFSEAESRYGDFKKFVSDFNIESSFLQEEVNDNRQGQELIFPIHNEVKNIPSFPHPYQKRLKDKLLLRLNSNHSDKIAASLPTGAGKTVLGMEVITDLIRVSALLNRRYTKILWLVSSKELAEQSLQSFKRTWIIKGDQAVYAQRFFGQFNNLKSADISQVTFGTFDLLVSRRNSIEVSNFLEEIDYLFIDEVHQAEAFTYEKIILKYQELSSCYKIIGLTATPFRTSDSEFENFKQNFNELFQLTDDSDKLVESPINYLTTQGYLSKVNFRILNNSEGNVSEAEFYRTLNKAVADECEQIIKQGQNTIIFARSKSHAVALSIYLTKCGLTNGLIVGETPDIVRKEMLGQFADKNMHLSILINHQILATGIDVPGMNSIFILGEIDSPSLALQILGRAMRGPKNGGNEQNMVYLTKQNFDRLSDLNLLESTVLN
jgi:DNA repair protein RadD